MLGIYKTLHGRVWYSKTQKSNSYKSFKEGEVPEKKEEETEFRMKEKLFDF